MKLPWDKEKEALERQYGQFSKMEITPASEKAYNTVAGVQPSTSVFDEIGHLNTLDKGHWRGVPELIDNFKYEVKSYPDGSKYVIVEQITNELTFRLNSYEDLWILNQIHDVVKLAGWKVTVTIPNLIDAQADRRFDIDQPHGLKLVCEFLNRLDNFNYKIFHPHNAEVVEALIENVEIIDSSNYLTRVLNWSSDPFIEGNINHIDMNNLVFLLPDGGAYKWGVKLIDKVLKDPTKYDILAAAKNRQYTDGHSKLVQQLPDYDFEGKDILIIDDICVYGGTFKGLAKMLRERNCGKLFLAISHLTIQELGKDPVTDYFEKVFTTNSKFEWYGAEIKGYKQKPKNLEVIKLF